jgi:hypothetical protein
MTHTSLFNLRLRKKRRQTALVPVLVPELAAETMLPEDWQT